MVPGQKPDRAQAGLLGARKKAALHHCVDHVYLYLFEDLFSRKAVGWKVFDCESAELSSQLLQDICARQGIRPDQLTVHSDNGRRMKGQTMLTTLQELGIAHSRSHPVAQPSATTTLRREPVQGAEVPF